METDIFNEGKFDDVGLKELLVDNDENGTTLCRSFHILSFSFMKIGWCSSRHECSW